MTDRDNTPNHVPEDDTPSTSQPTHATLTPPTPDGAANEVYLEGNVSSTVTEPSEPCVTVGFYGDYTTETIHKYYVRYKAAIKEAGITDAQLSVFLYDSALHLTPSLVTADIGTFTPRYADALSRSKISPKQIFELLAGSGLSLVPAQYAARSPEVARSVLPHVASGLSEERAPSQPGGEADVVMTEASDADTEAEKNAGKKIVTFSLPSEACEAA